MGCSVSANGLSGRSNIDVELTMSGIAKFQDKREGFRRKM